ncbi:MAG: hypothetical protein JWQ43_2611 [Glaciihabitans sp.]|nr:hypothetical protein [Glaciihabitans sp.]
MSLAGRSGGESFDDTLAENTASGRRGRHGRSPSTLRSGALDRATVRGTTLGTGYLRLGAGVLASVQALYGLALFASHWSEYPQTFPAVAAWVLYLLTFGASLITMSTIGTRMPTWVFAIFLFLLAGVVTLDIVAIWPLHNIGGYATSSVAAGFGLLLALTLRDGRVLLAAGAVLAIGLGTAIVLNTPLTPRSFPAQVGTIALAVIPVIIGVEMLRGYRRMVQLELDRVLVQSTVSAPRFAVGMLASEELARLDLAAEELLDAVATNRVPLPLSPKTASVAASLATELRLHLIEGRRETWLYHAITESELLGKAVTLTDRGSLAGLLDSTQRDGLLSAVWLLVSDTAKPNAQRTVQVTLGPMAAGDRRPGNRIAVPIVLTTTDVPRNRVDPATWESIRKIGRYSDSTFNSSLRLDIACLVENPADR